MSEYDIIVDNLLNMYIIRSVLLLAIIWFTFANKKSSFPLFYIFTKNSNVSSSTRHQENFTQDILQMSSGEIRNKARILSRLSLTTSNILINLAWRGHEIDNVSPSFFSLISSNIVQLTTHQ